MNLDDFPFDEILLSSNTEDELLEIVENYFKETVEVEVEGFGWVGDPVRNFVVESSPVGDSSPIPDVMRVYVALGEFSEEKYRVKFPVPRKLTTNWSLDAAQDLTAVHNMDILDNLSEIIAEEVVAEINKEAEAKQS